MSNFRISLSKTEAIILKRKEFEEADYFYYLYTKNWGKLIVRAHGVRKKESKLKSFLEPFVYGKFLLTNNQGRKILANVEVVDYFLSIRSNLEKISTAGFFAWVIDNLVLEGEADEDLWNLIVKAYKFLDQVEKFSENNVLKIQEVFLGRILEVLGYGKQPSPQKFMGELINRKVALFDIFKSSTID